MNSPTEHPENPETDLHLRQLMQEVNHIFSFSERREKEVMRHFAHGATVAKGKNARFQEAQLNQVFPETYLRNSCVKYRLRFLPSELFSGEVPFEVISAIKRCEHRYHNETLKFYILAPAEFFLLKDQYRSPLLFVARGNDSFEMLCQWGNKRPWYSQVLRYPFRDFKSLVISALITGFLVSVLAGMLGIANGTSLFRSIIYKFPLFVLTSGAFSTGALIYGLLTRTDFSSDNWNKRYFS